MSDEHGYLSATIHAAIGTDVDGLVEELGKIPERIFEIREKIAPIRAELKMRQERYASRGRSPSHADIIRATLMAKLKEEVRTAYNEDPDQRVDSKGNLVKIELTDGRCEDIAHAKQEYQEYVRKTNAEHRRIAELGKQLSPLYDELEKLKGVREYLNQYIEVAKAKIYAFNATSRL
jgi:chromosome segregation ATPase